MTRAAPPAGTSEPPRTTARDRSRIFICYRRRDSRHAARTLHQDLSAHFGEESVFMDVADISGGEEWEEVIRRELEACGSVIVLIGERWLAVEEGRRRIDDPADYVRKEVRLALACGAFVVPVLVDGAKMPRPLDLPDDLTPLAGRNAIALGDHYHWASDVRRLIATLEGRPAWRRKLIPAAGVALALAAALLAQSRLISRPHPVELAATDFARPTASRGQELVIERPLTGSAEGLLFSRAGRDKEFLGLSFAGARLGEKTRTLFEQLRRPDSPPPPSRAARLDLQTLPPQETPEEASGGVTCRTSVEVRAAPADAPPVALHLYQLETGDERLRKLSLKATGGELHVDVSTTMPDGGTPASQGCRKRLIAGDRHWDFRAGRGASFGISAVAEAGGDVRFSFAVAPGAPPRDGAGGLFRPFALGGAAEPGGPALLHAAAVHVRELGGQPSAPATSSVTAAGEPLRLNSLEVGPDLIRLGLSGRALVQTDGRHHLNLSDRLRRHPFAVTLCLVLDLVLVVWLLRLLLGVGRYLG